MSDQAMPTPEQAMKAQVDFYNKVWTDEAFRARLQSDPKAVLKEMGDEIPDDVQVKVVHDTDTVKYLHIPSPPPEGEISDADLENAQGGTVSWLVVSFVSLLTKTME